MNIFVGAPIKKLLTLNKEKKEKNFELIKNVCFYLEKNGFNVFSAHLVEAFGKREHLWTDNEICKRDFEWAVACDIYVAIIMEDNGEILNSDGLNIEIGWVSMLEKPIIVICNKLVRKQLSKVMIGLEEITNVEYVDIKNVEKSYEKIINIIREVNNEL